MTSEQSPEPSADGVPPVESEEELDLRKSMLMTQDWNFDVDSEDFEVTLTAADPRQKFKNLVRSAVKHDTFKKGEADTVRRIIEHVEMVSLKKSADGFNKKNFSIGVLNCFVICWVLGAYPEHIWLLYLIESFYMIPRKFYNMWRAKPLNQAFYYLDFCWFTNFFAMATLTAILISGIFGLGEIQLGFREVVFKAAMGVFCGVLACANIALPFVACLFHDVNTMTGLFIHLMPPVVMYTFVWHNDRIVEAWPSLFNLSYLEDGLAYFGGSDSISTYSTAFYFTWWVIYVCFMLGGGIDLPKKFKPDGSPANPKYDTVFHSTMRDGVCILLGKLFRGRSRAESLTLMETNMFDKIDFCLYMMFHMIASLTAIYVSGFLCFKSIIFFRLMLGASIVIAVVRGANRYTYYTTKMYSRVLRKEFAEQLARSGSDANDGYTRLT
eukprot:CAMPEP_0201691448 /NCGR_PEP_ID=MMETSP0578-20130828/4603_1 /ASSEMBLY_ACC=CAM_ASM_000663 /TAXON_ID=267565 /ORGANISM="Skeletonema grethea, Strain CCMP 1804" /LENGTH=438 /DNA_ID=CAMNT_0048176651 /DNA_START=17 /DNA_END=1333 /DNA_ORIENTATION=+